MVIVTCLDIIGTSFAFWTYGFKVVQMLTTMSTVDMTLLPILNMCLYQLFPKWKSYMIASIVLALIGTFIVEPLFAWGDIYILHEWKYIYSFPIYITFTTFLKCFVQTITAYGGKNMPNKPAITSSELGILWITYQEKTMVIQMLEYFIAKSDDDKSNKIMVDLYKKLNNYVEKVKEIFEDEGAVIPLGYTSKDVN